MEKIGIQVTIDVEKDIEKGPVAFPDLIALIFSETLDKYRQGAAKYGAFDQATDTRDLLKEAEAEILDATNYLAMFLMKRRTMRKSGT